MIKLKHQFGKYSESKTVEIHENLGRNGTIKKDFKRNI